MFSTVVKWSSEITKYDTKTYIEEQLVYCHTVNKFPSLCCKMYFQFYLYFLIFNQHTATCQEVNHVNARYRKR